MLRLPPMVAGLAALVLAVVTGCDTAEPVEDAASGAPPPASTSPAGPSAPPPVPSESPQRSDPAGASTTAPARPPHRVSLPAYFDRSFRGGQLRLRELRRTDSFTESHATYRSGDLTISGQLLKPHGPGPFPALVYAHGYIDPDIYVNGQGLTREQDHMAARGYVVLHVDYRGHADSSAATPVDQALRLGYTEDVIGAVLALKKQRYVDPERVGLLGRSMGGGVVYNVLVAQPGLVEAAVVFAPVSSLAADNFDRVTEPLMIHHGTSDDSCPIRWSRETVSALKRAGKQVRYHVYPGEEHAFGPQWPLSMERTARFFERNM